MKTRMSPAAHSPAVTAMRVVTGEAREICAAELTFKAVGGCG